MTASTNDVLSAFVLTLKSLRISTVDIGVSVNTRTGNLSASRDYPPWRTRHWGPRWVVTTHNHNTIDSELLVLRLKGADAQVSDLERRFTRRCGEQYDVALHRCPRVSVRAVVCGFLFAPIANIVVDYLIMSPERVTFHMEHIVDWITDTTAFVRRVLDASRYGLHGGGNRIWHHDKHTWMVKFKMASIDKHLERLRQGWIIPHRPGYCLSPADKEDQAWAIGVSTD